MGFLIVQICNQIFVVLIDLWRIRSGVRNPLSGRFSNQLIDVMHALVSLICALIFALSTTPDCTGPIAQHDDCVAITRHW